MSTKTIKEYVQESNQELLLCLSHLAGSGTQELDDLALDRLRKEKLCEQYRLCPVHKSCILFRIGE